MSKLRILALAILVWLASPGLSPGAQAQNAGPTVHIHAVEPPESVTPQTGGLPGLFLRATFSLLDADGTIMKDEIENATLRLGGDTYTAKFSKLETDWSVVILLDTSGTMSVGRAYTDFRTVRDGLTRALGNAPEYASFALIPFSDRAPTLVEFTPDREKIGNALKNVRPEYGKQACLNDGLYEAIAKLSNAPGRRAVFAITASADSCATRSEQMIADFASQNHVELYAVGIDGYTITRQELEAFTQPTGGLSETRGASELSFALDNIIGVLANQWQAVWVVYPSEGPQTGEVNVKLPDATVIDGSLTFVSDRSYARPPTVAVAGTAQSTLGGVRFNLDVINPERIAAIDVNLVSKLTGRSVYEDRLTEVSDSILLPSDNLVEDGEYSLTLTALDDQGQVLSQTEPLEFRFTPLQPSLKATVQQWPTAESPYFVVSAVVQNLEGVTSFRMWLEQDQGGAPIRGTEVTLHAGDELRLPVSGVRSGGYVVHVQALDAGDRILVESTELKVAYQAPGLVARLVAMVQGSTVAVVGVCGLGLLGAVGLGALVWFVRPRGKGMRNVELVLPEKARRMPRAAEPAAPAREPAAPSRPAPAPAAPPRAEDVRPAPPKAQPRPAPQAPAAPAPPRAEPARPAPPQQAPRPAQPAAVAPAPPRVEPARPAPPQQAPIPAQPAPVPPAPPRVEPAQAAVQRPAAPPARPAPVEPAAVPKPPEVLAVVSMADPRIIAFEAEIRKVPFRIGRSSDNDGVLPVEPTSGISGHHCFITFADGRWYLQDDTSKFGTKVNGQPIAKGQPFALEDGAIIGLGPKLNIQFRIVPAKGATH